MSLNKVLLSLAVFAGLWVGATMHASAKDETLYSDIVPSEFEGQVPVQIIGPGAKIRASIDAVDGESGGLIGGLVSGLLNKGSRGRAQERAVPVVNAMQGLPIEAFAKNSAEGPIRAYFKVPSDVAIPFASDDSDEAKVEFLRNATSDYVTFVEYDHSISPEFDAVTLITNIYVVSTDLSEFKKPEKVFRPKNLAFTSGIVSVIELPNPSKKKEENIAVWAANDAELVGKALELAFSKSEELTSRILNMDAAGALELKSKQREKVKLKLPLIAYSGRRQDHVGDGDVIWARYITKVEGYVFKTTL